MEILVTGHRGFIGSRVHRLVQGKGIDLKDGQNLISCDLPEADVIYHLAAQSSVEASWSDPVHDSDNLKMTVRLAHAYPNAKIVYVSSAATIEPIASPYGFSKWVAGEYLKRFHKNTVICVLPNVYGEGSKSVVDLFKGKDEVTVYGDGSHVRDYVHVDDIVHGLILARQWEAGTYELGSGIGTTVLELTDGKRVKLGKFRKEAKSVVLKNTTPNWKPTINVKEYLYA